MTLIIEKNKGIYLRKTNSYSISTNLDAIQIHWIGWITLIVHLKSDLSTKHLIDLVAMPLHVMAPTSFFKHSYKHQDQISPPMSRHFQSLTTCYVKGIFNNNIQVHEGFNYCTLPIGPQLS